VLLWRKKARNGKEKNFGQDTLHISANKNIRMTNVPGLSEISSEAQIERLLGRHMQFVKYNVPAVARSSTVCASGD
jgi:hypothetical protein